MRFPLPAGAEPETVAAGVNPGMASWLPLTARRAEAGAIGTVLILGVTGISGFLAVQNARQLGATRVIGAGRSVAGLERARTAGAETVALTGNRDADAGALAKVLGGDAPGIVLDTSSGELWPKPHSTPSCAADPAKTAATPGTSRSVRWPALRHRFRQRCCAAEG